MTGTSPGVGQVELPEEIAMFVRDSTGNYGKVKLVLQHNKFFVESPYPEILHDLLKVSLQGKGGVHLQFACKLAAGCHATKRRQCFSLLLLQVECSLFLLESFCFTHRCHVSYSRYVSCS